MSGGLRDRVLAAAAGAAALAVAVLLVAGGCSSECKAPTCGAGQTACGCSCVDLLTDLQNCGGCGWKCISGTSCVGGACTCPVGKTLCGSSCVDLNADKNNCGTCFQACGAGTCTAGACVCDPVATNCGGSPACVDTQTNVKNCGACNNVCPLKNEACVMGVCQCAAPRDTACPTGTPTACVDVQTDPANCGFCDTKCLVNGACSSGTCVCPTTAPTQCPAAPAAPTTCVNTQTDVKNCGSCGNACPPNQGCVNGLCTAGCTGLLCGTTCCGAGPTSCCGSDCPVAHENGLGQLWFDCVPLRTYDETQARAAATAWSDVGSFSPSLCGGTYCIDRTSGFNKCGRWCYLGFLAGLVYHDPAAGIVCQCPDPNGGGAIHTNAWQ